MKYQSFSLRIRVLTFVSIQMIAVGFGIQAKEISVMQYNVENLFDPDNPPPGHDEFTPDGDKHWTREKLKQKLINLGKVVTSIKNEDGSVCPDVLALCEVHNSNVLKYWKSGPLKVCNYTTTVMDPRDPDPRGIRTALLTRLELAAKPMSHTTYPGGRFIIETPLKLNEHLLVVFTNHWKSRVQLNGSSDNGEEKRKIAAKVLRDRILQLQEQNPDLDIAAFGDFNDEPENVSIAKSLGATSKPQELFDEDQSKVVWESSYDLLNSQLFADLEPESVGKAFKMMRSTYYFAREKAYNQLDHILLSKGLFDDQNFTFVPRSFQVVRLPEFTNPVNHSPIPFSDFSEIDSEGTAPRGASDHFPIMLRLKVQD